ncbi:MAG: hypothetical protein ACKVOP_07680 [Sphingomonadaceae bacterium]
MDTRSASRRTKRLVWLAAVRRELASARACANAGDGGLAGRIDAALAEAGALEAQLKANAARPALHGTAKHQSLRNRR